MRTKTGEYFPPCDSVLARAGHTVVDAAGQFLSEFTGLVVAGEETGRTLAIDGDLAARHADPDWCHAYADAIGHAVTPVGEQSHMTVMIDETGAFWGGYDDLYGFLGEDIVDVVQDLLVGPSVRKLDRVVVD